MDEDSIPACACHLMDVLADRPEFPIYYRVESKTYELTALDGLRRMRLYFCFGCGGRLPEEDYSRRAEPDGIERAEAEAVMSRARTVDDVLVVLGPPDEEVPWIEYDDYWEELVRRYPDQYEPARKWKRCLRYSKRWESLFLDVYEYDGGMIEHTIWRPTTSDVAPDR